MDEIAAAFNRQARFEGGLVESADDDGATIRTGSRTDPRTGSGGITGEKFSEGARVITVNGMVLGMNPFITE